VHSCLTKSFPVHTEPSGSHPGSIFVCMLDIELRRSPDDLRFYRALALLFIIFAIAHLVDPSHPPYVAEAQEYYHYSRVSLALSSPIRATTLEAIQTLVLVGYIPFTDLR
jgi:hypothetical protein